MSSPEQRKTAERPSEQSTLVGGPLDGGETWTGWVATRVWWLNSVLLLLVFLGVVALLVMVAKTNRKAGEAAGGPTENNDARDDSEFHSCDTMGRSHHRKRLQLPQQPSRMRYHLKRSKTNSLDCRLSCPAKRHS